MNHFKKIALGVAFSEALKAELTTINPVNTGDYAVIQYQHTHNLHGNYLLLGLQYEHHCVIVIVKIFYDVEKGNQFTPSMYMEYVPDESVEVDRIQLFDVSLDGAGDTLSVDYAFLAEGQYQRKLQIFKRDLESDAWSVVHDIVLSSSEDITVMLNSSSVLNNLGNVLLCSYLSEDHNPRIMVISADGKLIDVTTDNLRRITEITQIELVGEAPLNVLLAGFTIEQIGHIASRAFN